MKLIHTLLLALTANITLASDLTLRDCGVVIGHEMGGWEFFSFIRNPRQVNRVLKTDLKFVKVSLRKLKDGTWVVSHDPKVTFSGSPEETSKRLSLDQLTMKEINELNIPIYPLEEYIQRDQGRLCWMFTPKVSPDENPIKLLLKLNIQHRSVFTTGGIGEVAFLSSFPEEMGLNFAGRVGGEDQLEAYHPYLPRLWAMEVDPTPRAKEVITAVHKLGLRAYLDSMRYSKTYELFGSSCHKVFAMGADITQSNRALACIRKMGL